MSARLVILTFFSSLLYFTAQSQCLTDFTKLLPEPSLDYVSGFGSSFSVYDDVMAVGIPFSDSLGRLTGIVNVYKRTTGSSWSKIATVAPSDPLSSLAFGSFVKLSANYLAVGASGYGGRVYIFKKPGPDWESATENFILTNAGSQSFGTSMHNTIDISDDELTIAIVDQNEIISTAQSGAIYIYHRQPAEEWNDNPPARIGSPENDVQDFGRGGVYLLGDRIATASPFAPSGFGCGFIYRDPSGQFTNMTLEAKLRTTPAGSGTAYIGFSPMLFLDEGVVAVASVDENTTQKTGLVFFKKPASGNWITTEPTCIVDMPVGGSLFGNVSLSTNGNDIFMGYGDASGNRHFGVLKKVAADWCNTSFEELDAVSAGSSEYIHLYGLLNASHGNNAVMGTVTLPGKPNAAIALKTFHFNGSDWTSSVLYDSRMNTIGHRFGSSVLTLDDNLFVGSPNDGTVKRLGGAVYTYNKQGGTWLKTGKITLPETAGRYDDLFGYALATNGTQLAIGAPGFENPGKVFIYERNGSDWDNATLKQQIEIPEDKHPDVYGDYLAITDKWLVIPYQQTSPENRVHVAIYQKQGTQWQLFQIVQTEFNPFFSRGSTFPVDIEGETIIASNYIIERNAAGAWTIAGILSPSDPEPMRISSDFSHWISNGEKFGHSVDIQGDFIFVGAPQKDYQGTWDVGAVYVFARQPGFGWSSMTETAIIRPRVKDELELFGWSLSSLGNTLIVGAPGADFNKNGVTPRNKPGRAYIYQSKDYYWTDILALIDVTGDSFTKDYFGLSVGLDGANFIIGTPIEDITTGKLSGSIYVAPSPPIVKLVPPACVSSDEIQLFGYPFGGTWSGPGLKDAGSGIFSPSIAGTGIREFEYTTPSCTYTGRLVIEVMEAPVVTPITPNEILVCKGMGFTKKLEVAKYASTNYLWYYRAPGSSLFEETGERASSMNATKRGEYYVNAYNTACSTPGPIIDIQDEEIEVEIDDVPPPCSGPNSTIALSATPPGGTWSGRGVTGSTLSIPSPGDYPITYTYKSNAGCTFSDETTVAAKTGYTPTISRVTGNLCDQGQVTLGLGNVPGGITFDWQFKPEPSDTWSSTGITGVSMVAKDNGTYQVTTSSENCLATSQPFVLSDEMTVRLVPDASEVSICFGSSKPLNSNAPPGSTVHWSYAATLQAPPEFFSSDPTTKALKDGYYFVEAGKGTCSSRSSPIHVVVLPRDTLTAPNVFTPDGDGKNDVFTVQGERSDGVIVILNRYGNAVFTGNVGSRWDGGAHPAGVYFWAATIAGCEEEKKARGWVHLIR